MATESRRDAAAALGGVLEAQARLFGELTGLVAEQRRALLAADRERLEQLCREATTLATRFALLEDERGRLESAGAAQDRPDLENARGAAARALAVLLREAAVAGTVLERLGDTFQTRDAAVSSAFGTAYLPDGRPASAAPAGGALSAEG
ncbi:MAG: flagellar export chaperone FlgN [Acidobacteria bacterium]|nr:flagellar export chaperone FlgN [Acidobacteriota bacterium]